ncbi:MAG: CoA transferase [Gammaproteobacteria bacterium]|nr:MAG: CoA transferase [Gammaproteobacteria bacterium]
MRSSSDGPRPASRPSPAETPAVLEGIRVLDMSRVLAGPWAGQILADLGAEVIKIERPGSGDDTRAWGPPWLRDPQGGETGESAYYLCANRGKRSLAVDLTRPEGQELIRRLAAKSDVLIENFKAGGLKRYGLDHDSLHALNPGLVYCSITGFGQDGPRASQPGYDYLIQALGGLMSITGERDGRPGAGPQKVGVAITDLSTGLYAVIAILAALLRRQADGQGEYIDLALLDVQVATLANQAANYLVSGQVPQRQGNGHPNIVPYQSFETGDEPLVVAVGNDGQFSRLCALLGVPELAADPRFSTNARRVENRETLIPLLAARFRTRTAGEWLELLEQSGIPAGPINTIDRVFDDPQVRHRRMVQELPHPVAGRVPLVASPLRFTRHGPADVGPPPLLGEHSAEVLEELLGLDQEQIAALRREGIVQ